MAIAGPKICMFLCGRLMDCALQFPLKQSSRLICILKCTYIAKLNSYSNVFFYRFVACAFPFFEIKSVLPIDRYQNATSRAIHARKTGFYWSFCMSVLSLVVALESEWKRYSSLQSDKKTLAFEYEFSLIVWGELMSFTYFDNTFLHCWYRSTSYTSRFLMTGYVGIIWCSTTEATVVGVPLRVHLGYTVDTAWMVLLSQ